MARILVLLIGYIFGNIQTAFIYGKLHGIDIRQHGSGNSGTTNTLRVLGTKAGLIVFFGDLLKSVVAITIVRFTIGAHFEDIKMLLLIYTGAGCVLGHNFPVFMKFKGGKGIATTGGMMLSTHYLFIPVGILVFFGNLVITHMVSLGSLLLYVSFFVETIILGQLGMFNMSQSALIEMYVIVFLLACLAFYMHRENIKRLIAGNERKTYLFKKNKMDAETNASATK